MMNGYAPLGGGKVEGDSMLGSDKQFLLMRFLWS